MNLFVVPLAYLLDLVFGDPPLAWHPVRLIGGLIEKLEKRLNVNGVNKKFSGVVLLVLVVGVTVFCVGGILKLSRSIHPVFYYTTSVLFIYFALSVKSLGFEANKVYKALSSADTDEARKNLSMIVARDTDKLDESELIRATVETVAESTMDGIVAPLFYAFLGGPVLAWAYKAINTLDSMVGYRSERYIDFGKAAAKLDALVNFIPAKITCFLISLSAFCCGKDGSRAMAWAGKYLLKGPDANSEATEAAMAAALGVQLGGLNLYNSVPMQKPFIGDNLYPLNTKHIRESVNLAYISSALFMIITIIPFLIIGRR